MPKFWSKPEQTLTLLSQTLYETILYETRPTLQNSKQNILAANGGELFELGKTNLTLTIYDTVFQNDALVTQINADGMLGLDFMLANFCSVDVNHKVLLLQDKGIPLLVGGYIDCNRITTIKTVSIPSRAELLTVGQVLNDSRIPTNTCLIEPFAPGPTKEGFVTARTIVSPQETVTVRLLNVGEETNIIYPGTVIGQLSEVKLVESSEKDKSGQSKKPRPDLLELLKTTDSHLTREHKREHIHSCVSTLFCLLSR